MASGFSDNLLTDAPQSMTLLGNPDFGRSTRSHPGLDGGADLGLADLRIDGLPGDIGGSCDRGGGDVAAHSLAGARSY